MTYIEKLMQTINHPFANASDVKKFVRRNGKARKDFPVAEFIHELTLICSDFHYYGREYFWEKIALVSCFVKAGKLSSVPYAHAYSENRLSQLQNKKTLEVFAIIILIRELRNDKKNLTN
jgi:hypothetical protein